jgi:hypothetical protein
MIHLARWGFYPKAGGAMTTRSTSYIVTVLFVLFVAASLTACSGHSDKSSGGTDSVQQSGVGAVAISLYLPASYSDLRAATPLRNFYQMMQTRALNNCLREHGFDGQLPYTPETYNWSYANLLFPDLDLVERSGLQPASDLKGITMPNLGVPADQQKAFRAVSRGCDNSLRKVVDSYSTPWNALKIEWRNIDVRGDGDPKYLGLVTDFAACVNRHGYQGKTPREYLDGYMRIAMNAVNQAMSARASISLRMGKVYAECYRTANAYRQTVRQKARAQFLDEHALAIRAAQQATEESITRLSKTYSVKYEAVKSSS